MGVKYIQMNTQSNASHYDQTYLEFQKTYGKFETWIHLQFFSPFVNAHSRVLDFGCGLGTLLQSLSCAERIGIDINPLAREEAQKKGVIVYATSEEVPNEWADVVISDNALEHTFYPLAELQTLLTKLKPGGLAVFIVPCESHRRSFVHGDINQHLYSWSPSCLGNLFETAGFIVQSCNPIYIKCPPRPVIISEWVSRPVFRFLGRLRGIFHRNIVQIHIVAKKISFN